MMTQAQALYDFQYNKVKLASKPKVKTAYAPPRYPEPWDSRYIGCLGGSSLRRGDCEMRKVESKLRKVEGGRRDMRGQKLESSKRISKGRTRTEIANADARMETIT